MDKVKSKEDLAKLTDKELSEYAMARKVDLAGVATREDAIAMIELHDEAATKEAAKSQPAKPVVRAGASGKRARKPEGAELTGEQIVAVQKVWAKFARSIAQPVMSAGVYEMEKDQRKDAPDHGVPDGDYRIVGADWILTFERGRFVEAARGGPNTKSDSYASVPASEHPVPR